jgi:hypothetical protein
MQTILVDTIHSLRKRVRAAQKEKLTLREEILRIRQEREQVALRMDAVRIKHEAETEDAVHRLDLSTAMHNIDLAVDRGRNAPELTPAQRRAAELGNLELAIAKIADQACSKSGNIGTLRQIRDFNAFLERAFVALETKATGPRGG